MALALLVGAILVIGSLFRLGWIANLLSTPVTTGFLAGISVHILVSQMPGVLGLPTPSGPMLDRIAHAGAASRRGQPLHGLHRVRRARRRRRIGSDQRQNSRRADRAGRGDRRRDLGRSRKQGRQRGRRRSGNAADAVISGSRSRAMGAAAAAEFPDRHCRDGADRGDHALVSVRSRQTRRCRPRFSRRRRRQSSRRPVRRVSGQRQPAANRHRVRDRRPLATLRAVRRRHRARAAGLRRHAVAARAECGARRRAAVRGAAHHPRQTDRRRSIASRSANSC